MRRLSTLKHGQRSAPKRGRSIAFIPLDAYVDGQGWRVSIVKEGVAGHYPTGTWPCPPGGTRPWFWGHDYEKAKEFAVEYNRKLGVSPEDALAIVSSSMIAQAREDRVGFDKEPDFACVPCRGTGQLRGSTDPRRCANCGGTGRVS